MGEGRRGERAVKIIGPLDSPLSPDPTALATPTPPHTTHNNRPRRRAAEQGERQTHDKPRKQQRTQAGGSHPHPHPSPSHPQMKGGGHGGSGGPPPLRLPLPSGSFLDHLPPAQKRARFNLLLLEHGEVYLGAWIVEGCWVYWFICAGVRVCSRGARACAPETPHQTTHITNDPPTNQPTHQLINADSIPIPYISMCR